MGGEPTVDTEGAVHAIASGGVFLLLETRKQGMDAVTEGIVRAAREYVAKLDDPAAVQYIVSWISTVGLALGDAAKADGEGP